MQSQVKFLWLIIIGGKEWRQFIQSFRDRRCKWQMSLKVGVRKLLKTSFACWCIKFTTLNVVWLHEMDTGGQFIRCIARKDLFSLLSE